MSDPREGLPPGVREACFDGRLALLLPKGPHGDTNRLVLGTAGKLFRCHFTEGFHHEMVNPRIQELDDDEVEAAFERGAEWVRTGEGP